MDILTLRDLARAQDLRNRNIPAEPTLTDPTGVLARPSTAETVARTTAYLAGVYADYARYTRSKRGAQR